ncbi:MAG TPA: amidohydrolase family protein [Mycobacteriales bacterium]|nr:amidohydrolase family protein [Mycobacteriales bacterium]
MQPTAFGVFDGDNHYYEALDAFTRHLDPRHGRRVIEWAEVGGRRYHVIGGRVNHTVVNPTFDPVSPAGALSSYFRGNPDGQSPLELLKAREPIRPEYRDRDARLAVMDAQGLEKIWLFPTLGMVYEEPLKHDPGAVVLMFQAFNRWLEEDWGYAYADRIFASPYITLADPVAAAAEVDRVLGLGARTVCVRPAAPVTERGPLPPTDPVFDPVWARLDEAGVTVVVHAGDSGYPANGYAADGFSTDFSGGGRPSIKMLAMERAIYDFLASLVFDKLFDRFPNLRVASVENGSEFLGDLFRKLRSVGRRLPGWFSEDPVETFRRHIWINPFWEDDVHGLLGLMGADRVVFGSDWPHIEALPQPLDYLVEVKELDDTDRRKVMRDNAEELNTPRPA